VSRRRELRRAASGNAGFSLVEVMIVFILSLVALSIATGLLIESTRRANRATAGNLETPVDLAFRQIRADLRASSGVEGGDEVWNHLPLVLSHHPAGKLRYEVVDGDLQRIAGDAATGRVLLPGISYFRWRLQWLGRFAVEVEVARFERSRVQAVSGPAGVSAGSETLQTWHALVTPRSVGTTQW